MKLQIKVVEYTSDSFEYENDLADATSTTIKASALSGYQQEDSRLHTQKQQDRRPQSPSSPPGLSPSSESQDASSPSPQASSSSSSESGRESINDSEALVESDKDDEPSAESMIQADALQKSLAPTHGSQIVSGSCDRVASQNSQSTTPSALQVLEESVSTEEATGPEYVRKMHQQQNDELAGKTAQTARCIAASSALQETQFTALAQSSTTSLGIPIIMSLLMISILVPFIWTAAALVENIEVLDGVEPDVERIEVPDGVEPSGDSASTASASQKVERQNHSLSMTTAHLYGANPRFLEEMGYADVPASWASGPEDPGHWCDDLEGAWRCACGYEGSSPDTKRDFVMAIRMRKFDKPPLQPRSIPLDRDHNQVLPTFEPVFSDDDDVEDEDVNEEHYALTRQPAREPEYPVAWKSRALIEQYETDKCSGKTLRPPNARVEGIKNDSYHPERTLETGWFTGTPVGLNEQHYSKSGVLCETREETWEEKHQRETAESFPLLTDADICQDYDAGSRPPDDDILYAEHVVPEAPPLSIPAHPPPARVRYGCIICLAPWPGCLQHSREATEQFFVTRVKQSQGVPAEDDRNLYDDASPPEESTQPPRYRIAAQRRVTFLLPNPSRETAEEAQPPRSGAGGQQRVTFKLPETRKGSAKRLKLSRFGRRSPPPANSPSPGTDSNRPRQGQTSNLVLSETASASDDHVAPAMVRSKALRPRRVSNTSVETGLNKEISSPQVLATAQ